MKKETILKIADAIREAEKQNGTLEYCSEILGYREWKSIENLDTNESADNIVLRIRITNYIKPEPTKRLPTIEEVEKWFLENKVFSYKDTRTLVRIAIIERYSETPIFTTNDDGFTLSQFCEQLKNYDGSELYITENE